MSSFSIILTSLRSLNLSFPLLFYAISTATVSTLIPFIATLIPYIFCISTQIPRILTLIPHIRTPIPFPAFPYR